MFLFGIVLLYSIYAYRNYKKNLMKVFICFFFAKIYLSIYIMIPTLASINLFFE